MTTQTQFSVQDVRDAYAAHSVDIGAQMQMISIDDELSTGIYDSGASKAEMARMMAEARAEYERGKAILARAKLVLGERKTVRVSTLRSPDAPTIWVPAAHVAMAEAWREVTLKALSLHDQAVRRVETTPELKAHEATIFADWKEGDEHDEWIATAPVAEIVDWAETVERQ